MPANDEDNRQPHPRVRTNLRLMFSTLLRTCSEHNEDKVDDSEHVLHDDRHGHDADHAVERRQHECDARKPDGAESHKLVLQVRDRVLIGAAAGLRAQVVEDLVAPVVLQPRLQRVLVDISSNVNACSLLSAIAAGDSTYLEAKRGIAGNKQTRDEEKVEEEIEHEHAALLPTSANEPEHRQHHDDAVIVRMHTTSTQTSEDHGYRR